MKPIHVSSAVVILLLCSVFCQAQQTVATNTNVAVPPLINFSGTLTDANGKPVTGTVAVTFSLYSEQSGGAALWMETQNVQPDLHGYYTVLLGSTSSNGLPSDIFVAGEAHWLGVQVQGEDEQPRVLLVSAPYALKAGDAQTLGGLPASAFVLAAPASGAAAAAAASEATPEGGTATAAAAALPLTTSDVTTTGGTVNAIPLFSTATNIQNSLLTQTGKTAINVVGKLNLPATGTATSSAGLNSRPQDFVASVFNSSTGTAVPQTFQLQAEPADNDTASASGTLNLLYGSGTTAPAETGLKIGSTGLITFATGQTFPGTGTGDGTITGVTAGTDLTGGGTSGNVTLNLNTSALNSTYAQIGATNTFVGNQAITGNLTDTGNISATGEITAQYEQLTNNSFTPSLYVSQSGNGNGIFVNAPGASEAIFATSSTAGSTGILGGSTNGTGVVGTDIATSGSSVGVSGISSSPGGVGVSGQVNSPNTIGVGIGVYGTSSSTFGGIGVLGTATGYEGIGGDFDGGPSGSISGDAFPGGHGMVAQGGADISSKGYGAGNGGVFVGGGSTNGTGGDGGDFTGGSGATGGDGVYAAAGEITGSTITYPIGGVVGIGPGPSNATIGPGVFGNDGSLSSTGSLLLGGDFGVWGDVIQEGGTGAPTPIGVTGTADNALAMLAQNASATYPAVNVVNFSTSSTAQAILASIGSAGGIAVIGADGCSGTMGLQLGLSAGMSSNCENYTLQGDISGNTYLNASGSGKIVFRINNVAPAPMSLNNNGSVSITSLDVTSSLTKPAGSFKIDHPLDPANKYLYHSFVESPDMKNIYDGNVITDGEGLATVNLPDWFEALNRDFRYQLTVIGQFAQAIVAHEIENNQFQIRTSLPNVKVSWQVTGIRQDAFANAHRIQTEVEKAPADRGHYLHPELFGAPETARIGYEAPSKLAPAGEKSASASARPSGARPRQLMRPNRPLPALPKLPKLPEVKTPPKPTIAQASK